MPVDVITIALGAGLSLVLVILAVLLTNRISLTGRISELKGAIEQERETAQAAKDAESAALQEKAKIETRLIAAEDAHKRFEDAAKAAVAQTAREVSSKLLDDHKRESKAARDENEASVKKTTTELQTQFKGIVESVAALSDQTKINRETVGTVLKSLSHPGGAGHFAEIGLENTLKTFGLIEERDFILQRTHKDEDDAALRPDAIVFLPYESILVIDSKASKFLLELAEADGAEQEARAYESLVRTMKNHLKSLASKDYRAAVTRHYRRSGHRGKIRRVLSVMYLPNEGALEKLNAADPQFQKVAAKHNIIPAGPSGLAGLIGFARIEIDLAKQAENQEEIVHATELLLDSVIVVLDYASGVGKGIRAAAKQFGKLGKSINTRLLPRARALGELGVKPTKSRDLPGEIAGYELRILENGQLIDGEAEQVSDTGEPEN